MALLRGAGVILVSGPVNIKPPLGCELINITSAQDIGSVPSDLVGAFNLIFYTTPQEAVFKALGVD